MNNASPTRANGATSNAALEAAAEHGALLLRELERRTTTRRILLFAGVSLLIATTVSIATYRPQHLHPLVDSLPGSILAGVLAVTFLFSTFSLMRNYAASLAALGCAIQSLLLVNLLGRIDMLAERPEELLGPGATPFTTAEISDLRLTISIWLGVSVTAMVLAAFRFFAWRSMRRRESARRYEAPHDEPPAALLGA